MSSLTLLQSLHESLSTRAQVSSVFGEPIAANDKTIIPVAKIAYGFGGGTGSGGMEIKSTRGEGGGGGGGVGVIPIGVFEVSSGETRFVAVGDRKKTVGTLLLGAALGLLFARRSHDLGTDATRARGRARLQSCRKNRQNASRFSA